MMSDGARIYRLERTVIELLEAVRRLAHAKDVHNLHELERAEDSLRYGAETPTREKGL